MRRIRTRSKKERQKGYTTGLPMVREGAAGIDVGSQDYWVCCPERKPGEPNVRQFGETTRELEALAEYMEAEGIQTVAMESTGLYWVPLYNLLQERGFEVLLVDARQLKRVPGRPKTDKLDCQWIQRLHSCGLLTGCFRPTGATLELRTIARERSNLKEEMGRVVQRMQKALDCMNIKIHHAVTDLTGVTGMAILRAIVEGQRDPLTLAQLRDRRCKKSVQQIAELLQGTWMPEHLFTLGMQLGQYEFLQQQVQQYDQHLVQRFNELTPAERENQPVPAHPNAQKEKDMTRRGEQPLRTALWRFSGIDLTLIPGISVAVALTFMTEVGLDIHRFPTSKHFVSWLRITKPMHVSAGRKSKKKNQGFSSSRIARTLRMAALSLKRSQTWLGAFFRKLSARKEYSVAIVATARKLAEHLYRALAYGQHYLEQGVAAFEAKYQQRQFQYAEKVAKSMGYLLVPADMANQVSS